MNEEKPIDFDDFANDYRQSHTANVKTISGKDSYYFSKLKVQELTYFETNNQLQLLDIGCGDGVSEIYFQQFFDRFAVNAVDISEASILKAKAKSIPNTSFSTYSGVTLPFANDSFDIVFVGCVLHHVQPDKQLRFMQEAIRVLKKGGRLYIFEHNPYNPVTQHLVNTCEFDRGVKLIRPSTLKRMLKNAGGKLQGLHFIIFFPRYKLFQPLLFLEKYARRIPIGGQYFLRGIKC